MWMVKSPPGLVSSRISAYSSAAVRRGNAACCGVHASARAGARGSRAAPPHLRGAASRGRRRAAAPRSMAGVGFRAREGVVRGLWAAWRQTALERSRVRAEASRERAGRLDRRCQDSLTSKIYWLKQKPVRLPVVGTPHPGASTHTSRPPSRPLRLGGRASDPTQRRQQLGASPSELASTGHGPSFF